MFTRLGWLIGVFALSVVLGGGLWVWITFIAVDQDPEFEAVVVQPESLRFVGGPVMVEVQVTDDFGIRKVEGAVFRSGDRQFPLELAQRTNGEETRTYIAEFSVPSNIRSDGQAVQYTLQLNVVDSVGQETSEEIDFQVSAPAPPPNPPK